MRVVGQRRIILPRSRRLRLAGDLPIEANVRLRAIARDGSIMDERVGHNVLTNIGRNWITRLLAPARFPTAADADMNMSGDNGQAGDADNFSPVGKTYRARYVGFGVGGTLQTISPPGPGGQTEHAGVTGLERQIKITATDYLRQIEPNDDVNDPLQFPDDYTVRLRAVFSYDDISFPGQPTYGTDVPLTEVALYTSQAAPTVAGGSGCVCYHQFSPFSKNPNFAIELLWELRG